MEVAAVLADWISHQRGEYEPSPLFTGDTDTSLEKEDTSASSCDESGGDIENQPQRPPMVRVNRNREGGRSYEGNTDSIV